MPQPLARPLILIYEPMPGGFPEAADLSRANRCTFTVDRGMIAEADAVVFHLPTMRNIWDVPKYPGQAWVAWCMESSVTCPALAADAIMGAFDIRMTYQRSADVWCSYVPRELRVAVPAAPWKTRRVPLVMFQSARYDRWGRNDYLRELMRHIPMHSFGSFMRNRHRPWRDSGRPTKLRIIRRYRFSIAFENSLAEDYVTEKFFGPLVAGSVPVYYGAPNIGDFAPGPGCFVNARDFSGPAELAAHLSRIAADAAAYAEFHRWRQEGVSDGFRTLLDACAAEPFDRLVDLVRRRSEPPRPDASAVPDYPLRWLKPPAAGTTADGAG